jgi:uridine kinase
MSRASVLHQIADHIRAKRPPHPLRVGIDGIDAAGKTSLADELAELLTAQPANTRPVIRASVDRFHNPRAIRYQLGPDSALGYYQYSFNYTLLRSRLLDPLGPGGDRRCHTEAFDFRSDTPIDSPLRLAPPDAVLLFDGVFLMRPELTGCWDLTIFVEISFETCVQRALQRDLNYLGSQTAVRQQYRRRYIPGQQLYLESCQPRQRADMILVNDDPANPELHVLQSLQS